ncbi:uncharacterized protein DDB_G0283697-like [Sabethes cyaneus]|uniref:uncharacterized protein DDB_G0283697-like n=1 Tax=Sabethes cyaneus TaxID=53552 RepID=UPI00237EA0C9|nr:uncharacterized protein DDB_G0283697-like [Sabethes cyaneus]
MDQYPYSIPPTYQPYSDEVANKPGPDAQVSSAADTYYVNTGSAVAGFGFVPPIPQQQQQQQENLPPVQANGLMPSIQTGSGPAGYELYPNQQFATVPEPIPVNSSIVPMETSVDPVTIPQMIPVRAPDYEQPNYIREANDSGQLMGYQAIPVPETQPEQVMQTTLEPAPQAYDEIQLGMEKTASNLPNDEPITAAGTNEEVTASQEQLTEVSPSAEPTTDHTESMETPIPEALPCVETAQPDHTESTETPIPEVLPCVETAQPVSNDGPEQNEPPASVEDVQMSEKDTSAPLTSTDVPSDAAETQPEAAMEIDSTTTPVASSKPVEIPEDHSSITAKKKRRRIVQLNDDDDSEEEDGPDRLELLRSPEPPKDEEEPTGTANVGLDACTGDEKPNDDDAAAAAAAGSEREDDERPGSADSGEKRSAVSIFQNVVMIPAGDSDAHKRKKIRVLESDDEEEEQRVTESVDDIGLTGDGDGGDELNRAGDLLIDENAELGDYGAMEGIEMDKMEQIVTMDAPIIDPSRMINEDDDDDEDDDENENDAGSEGGEKEKDGSDQEEEEAEGSQDEELGEEEEVVEEGVEMITAEDDDGEAIGIATDDEKELEEEKTASEENDDRGSSQENQASDAEQSDQDQPSGEESSKEEEETRSHNRSVSRSATASPVDGEKESRSSDQRKGDGHKSGSEDDVVCQNDLELNTISLLTDEEDDNTTPLPPPKKELPVVRIVNIKKELLDTRFVKREPGLHKPQSATSYQQQHYLKQQQQMAQRKEEKQKKKQKKQRIFDNNDPFGAWSSSSSEDEFIPNDIYFGTPDRVFTASTKIRCQRQKMANERYSKYTGGKSGKRHYTDDSDVEERRKRKQKMEQIARLNLPAYQQAQLQSLVKKKNKKKHGRFYDKSQDIPNDIYFGNVNVPLHVLYAFGSSSSDDERADQNRPNTSWRPPQAAPVKHGKYQTTSKSYKTTSSSSYSKSTVSPSNDRSVQAMKEYLKIAGFKNVKFHKLWEGCKSNQERANAILRLMQEKGLEGEPTIAKCRELRKQLQMEREAKVLDTSLIIDGGEGRITRRSARQPQNQNSSDPSDPNAPSTSGLSQAPVVPPESLETLNRIRNVIDPDSDGE